MVLERKVTQGTCRAEAPVCGSQICCSDCRMEFPVCLGKCKHVKKRNCGNYEVEVAIFKNNPKRGRMRL